MTVPSTTNIVSYVGTGSLATYPIPFEIILAADVVAYSQSAAGVTPVLLILNTDYTVGSLGILTGATFTLLAGNLATGAVLTIARDPAQVQDTPLQAQGPLPAPTVEQMVDLLTMEVQANRTLVNNSIKIPLVEALSGLNTILPVVVQRAGKLLGFDSSGNAVAITGTSPVLPSSIYDVAAFGAVGDGVTNDLPAIQAAVNAASAAGGGIVYAAAKTYSLNGQLVLASNIHLQGSGQGTVFKLANGAGASLPSTRWITASGATGITISDITFNGNSANNTSTYFTLYFATCSFVKLDRYHVINAYGGCTAFGTCTDITISNFTFTNITGAAGNPGEGIYAIATLRMVITNGVAFTLADHMIYLDGTAAGSDQSTDISLTNLQAYNCGLGTVLPYGAAFNVYRACQRVTFTNCNSFNSGLGWNIHGLSPDFPVDIQLIGCNAVNSGGANNAGNNHGFSVSGNTGGTSMRLLFSGCKAYLSGAGQAGSVSNGFYFQDTLDILVLNCISDSNNDHGMKIARCQRVRIVGGEYQNNGQNHVSPTRDGIHLGDDAGGMPANSNVDILIEGVRTTDTAASGKLQNYGIGLETGCAQTYVRGGRHDGNAGGAYIRNGSADATNQFSDSGLDGSARSFFYAAAVPSSGVWAVGDLCLNEAPASGVGGVWGWACVSAGSPGTWAPLGTVLPPSFGEIYQDVSGGTTITVTTAGTYYLWGTGSNGALAGVGYVTTTTGELLIGASGGGTYRVTGRGSAKGPNSAAVVMAVQKNATPLANLTCRVTMGATALQSTFVVTGILSGLALNDLISLAFTSSTNGDVITFYDMSLTIERISS